MALAIGGFWDLEATVHFGGALLSYLTSHLFICTCQLVSDLALSLSLFVLLAAYLRQHVIFYDDVFC